MVRDGILHRLRSRLDAQGQKEVGMVIKTDVAEFGSFRDLEIYMRHEKLDAIELVDVHYWGIDLSFTKGTYIYSQILEILHGC